MSDDSEDRRAQAAADEALAAAVDDCSVAYHGQTGRVITEYVVVAARQGWDAAGDPVTSVETIDSPSGPAPHRVLGLLEYAAARYRHLIDDADEA